jgi:hypothetical protein
MLKSKGQIMTGEAHASEEYEARLEASEDSPLKAAGRWTAAIFSATLGDARYIEAFPRTMPTQSVKAGMYAPPAADGPCRQQIWGTRPDSLTCN